MGYLKKAKKNAVNILVGTLWYYIDENGKLKDWVRVKDVSEVLDKIKVELKEPTNITRQFNTDVIDDSLTDDELKTIEEMKKEKEKQSKKDKKPKKSPKKDCSS
jgi:hypothetical protein